MGQDLLGLNKDAYDQKYEKGYGVMYPEGHIIRIYEHFLKYELGILGDGKKLYDFGCGNGTHAVYFDSKGFDVYGSDIASSAIDICKKRLPEKAGQFKVVAVDEDHRKLFNTKFDVILANQVLYYFTDANMEETLRQLDEILNPGGIVIFTMMGAKNYYYQLSKDVSGDGLRRVELTGRLHETTYINFTMDEADLKGKFKLFNPVFVGYYDFLAREGSTFHYIFIGKKR